MEALNIEAEYRQAKQTDAALNFEGLGLGPIPWGNAQEYANSMVKNLLWVEDDGDYYTREEWDSQYAEDSGTCATCWGIVPDPDVHYVPEDGTLCDC